MVHKMFSLKEKYLRFRNGSVDMGFDYETFKARSHSSASDSTNSISEDDIFELPTTPPVHPIPTMQGAFEESMRFPDVDVENACNPRKYELRYHPLIKTVAQISFGLHLLHKRLAKSEQEVVKILQRHVDDMNKFLNRTTRNFDLATSDIEERHKNLRTALDNASVFEKMLVTDPAFRQQISDGNKKVEYVIKKTTIAMEKSLRDVYEGMRGVDELGRYLLSMKKGWKNTGLIRTYGAMTSNVEVWARSLETLRKAGLNLGLNLEKLKTVVNQVEKKVRKTSKSAKGKYKASDRNENVSGESKPRSSSISSSTSADRHEQQQSNQKGLKHSRSMPGIPQRTSSLRASASLRQLKNRDDDSNGPNPKRSRNSDDDLDLPVQIPTPSPTPAPTPTNYHFHQYQQPQTQSSHHLQPHYTPSTRPYSPTPLDRISEASLNSLPSNLRSPKPLSPNHWKPLPPTPPSPTSSNMSVEELHERPAPSPTRSARHCIQIIPDCGDGNEDEDDNCSPVIIELSPDIGEFTSENGGTFRLKPIFESSSRSSSPGLREFSTPDFRQELSAI